MLIKLTMKKGDVVMMPNGIVKPPSITVNMLSRRIDLRTIAVVDAGEYLVFFWDMEVKEGDIVRVSWEP